MVVVLNFVRRQNTEVDGIDPGVLLVALLLLMGNNCGVLLDQVHIMREEL